MTRQQLEDHAEYLTATQQRIRNVGLNGTMFANVRESIESSDEFRKAPKHVRDEILAALEARRKSIAKVYGAI